eukprot:365857-Chlamydomonas_euryale.AAC.5
MAAYAPGVGAIHVHSGVQLRHGRPARWEALCAERLCAPNGCTALKFRPRQKFKMCRHGAAFKAHMVGLRCVPQQLEASRKSGLHL